MLINKLLPIMDNCMLMQFNNTIDTIITNDMNYVIWGPGTPAERRRSILRAIRRTLMLRNTRLIMISHCGSIS